MIEIKAGDTKSPAFILALRFYYFFIAICINV